MEEKKQPPPISGDLVDRGGHLRIAKDFAQNPGQNPKLRGKYMFLNFKKLTDDTSDVFINVVTCLIFIFETKTRTFSRCKLNVFKF